MGSRGKSVTKYTRSEYTEEEHDLIESAVGDLYPCKSPFFFYHKGGRVVCTLGKGHKGKCGDKSKRAEWWGANGPND